VSLQAIVLAGGLGTRLRGVIGDLPKTMARVAGRPFLEHVLNELVGQRFGRVVLAVGYRRDVIKQHFGGTYRALTLDYAEEAEPLGTGGALRQALQFMGTEPCFVLNSDTWAELDYAAMLEMHRRAAAQLTIAVRAVEDVQRFGAVEVHNDRVCRFAEKGHRGPGFINAGTYLLAGS
jgi:D-glycero-alpha-D-manno-heptose 1-phosphate guanylyltransferase